MERKRKVERGKHLFKLLLRLTQSLREESQKQSLPTVAYLNFPNTLNENSFLDRRRSVLDSLERLQVSLGCQISSSF
jgi:hypothetical protein